MDTMNVFGDQQNLVGWYSAPSTGLKSDVAVVMLTPGMLSHIGPMRLHVQLARGLERIGIASFRFDLSGIGESLPVGASGCSLKRAAKEIRQALDLLENQYGLKKFALFGLCSGADDALAASLQDERVIGLSLMDGCGFRTKRFYLNHFRQKYLPKILSFKKWQELLSNRLGGGSRGYRTMPMGQDVREFADRDTCQEQVHQLLARGTRMQWIYTGGSIDYYSYANQFFEMFPLLRPNPLLCIHHYPIVDHLATMRQDREQIQNAILDWCGGFIESHPRTEPTKAIVIPASVSSFAGSFVGS
jgi:hypothetical protein